MRLAARALSKKFLGWWSFFLCSAVFQVSSISPCSADYLDNPDPIPGWTHADDLSRDTPKKHGIILSGGNVTFSSPVIGEINGNAADGLEVAVGSADGILHAYKSDGTALWSVSLPNANCSQSSSTNKLLSSPAVGELFGNGVPYVVVGYGGLGGSACGGGVVAVNGTTGQVAWHLDLKAFAKKERFGSISHAVFSSPAIADTDRDGRMEIGFGSYDRNVYLLNADGSVRWYYNAADTVWSSPAFANVDRDSALEMIIGTDISGNSRLRPPTQDGGYVYAFKTAPKAGKSKRIFFRTKSHYVWQAKFDQVIYSSPVVADVIPNSPGPEVIVGSGCFFPQRSNKKRGRWFKILKLSNGKVLRTLPVPGCSSSSAAVGDVDEDGLLDVIVTVNGDRSIGGDGNSRIMAFKPTTASVIWSVIPTDRGRNNSWGGNFQSPSIADLDGNGSLEVLASNGASVHIFNGRDGAALTCQGGGCSAPYTLYTWDTLQSTPAVGDVNGDGKLDVVIAGGHAASRERGVLYGWTGFGDFLNSTPGGHLPLSVPWMMYRGNPRHTAHYSH